MSGWNRAKVDVFSGSFYDFLDYLPIDSKDLGSHTILGQTIFRAQRRFLDTVWDALADDVHEIYVLKSRQQGLSTISRALSLFWIGMHDGLRGGIVFDTNFNVQQARRETLSMMRALPRRFKFPRVREDNRDNLILENGSSVLFLSAGRSATKSGGGLGRSVGLNFAHVSEVSSFVNDEGLTSFRQSLSQVFDNRLYIWESTARGYNNWHAMWEEAKEDDLSKRTVFIGWWAKDNQCFEKGTPEYERFATTPPTKHEAARIAAVRDQYDWQITPGQLGWYRRLTDPAQDHDDDEDYDSLLLQEQPWTETEAWQQTGSNFFSSDALTAATNRILSQPQPTPYAFWPGSDFVSCSINPSRGKRETNLWVWEDPAIDGSYVIAGDPAFGRDESNDHSAAQVLRCYADGVDQVAEFSSALCPPHNFAWLLLALVGWYGGSKPGARALMIVEINGPGEEAWRQYQSSLMLLRQGYLRRQAEEKGISNLYGNARSYIYSRSDSMTTGHNYQFRTNAQLKVQIMEAYRNYMQNGAVKINSIAAVEEARSISRDGDRIGAEGRHRDDRTFALAMGIRAWDEKVRRTLILGNRTRQAERARLSITISDQKNLFDTYMLARFFETKERGRIAAARSSRQDAIHRMVRQPPRWRR